MRFLFASLIISDVELALFVYVGHLYIFGKISIQVLCPFFNWIALLLKGFYIYIHTHIYICYLCSRVWVWSQLQHVGSFIGHEGSSLWCMGFSLIVVRGLQRAQGHQLQHTGSLVVACGLQSVCAYQFRRVGLVTPWHVGSQFPDQRSNPRPLHCKMDS